MVDVGADRVKLPLQRRASAGPKTSQTQEPQIDAVRTRTRRHQSDIGFKAFCTDISQEKEEEHVHEPVTRLPSHSVALLRACFKAARKAYAIAMQALLQRTPRALLKIAFQSVLKAVHATLLMRELVQSWTATMLERRAAACKNESTKRAFSASSASSASSSSSLSSQSILTRSGSHSRSSPRSAQASFSAFDEASRATSLVPDNLSSQVMPRKLASDSSSASSGTQDSLSEDLIGETLVDEECINAPNRAQGISIRRQLVVDDGSTSALNGTHDNLAVNQGGNSSAGEGSVSVINYARRNLAETTGRTLSVDEGGMCVLNGGRYDLAATARGARSVDEGGTEALNGTRQKLAATTGESLSVDEGGTRVLSGTPQNLAAAIDGSRSVDEEGTSVSAGTPHILAAPTGRAQSVDEGGTRVLSGTRYNLVAAIDGTGSADEEGTSVCHGTRQKLAVATGRAQSADEGGTCVLTGGRYTLAANTGGARSVDEEGTSILAGTRQNLAATIGGALSADEGGPKVLNGTHDTSAANQGGNRVDEQILECVHTDSSNQSLSEIRKLISSTRRPLWTRRSSENPLTVATMPQGGSPCELSDENLAATKSGNRLVAEGIASVLNDPTCNLAANEDGNRIVHEQQIQCENPSDTLKPVSSVRRPLWNRRSLGNPLTVVIVSEESSPCELSDKVTCRSPSSTTGRSPPRVPSPSTSCSSRSPRDSKRIMNIMPRIGQDMCRRDDSPRNDVPRNASPRNDSPLAFVNNGPRELVSLSSLLSSTPSPRHSKRLPLNPCPLPLGSSLTPRGSNRINIMPRLCQDMCSLTDATVEEPYAAERSDRDKTRRSESPSRDRNGMALLAARIQHKHRRTFDHANASTCPHH